MIVIAFTCLLSLVVSRNHKKFFNRQTNLEQNCRIRLTGNNDRMNELDVTIGCGESNTNGVFKYLSLSDLEDNLKEIRLYTINGNCLCNIYTKDKNDLMTSEFALDNINDRSDAISGKKVSVVMMICKPYGDLKKECEIERNKPYKDEKAKNAELRTKNEDEKKRKI